MNKVFKISLIIVFLFVLGALMVFSERLPIVGGDNNNWGTVLNNFLNVSLDENGSLRAGVGDGLGNHTASEDLNMGGNSLLNITSKGLNITDDGTDIYFTSFTQDADIYFRGNDGGDMIDLMSFDTSADGNAFITSDLTIHKKSGDGPIELRMGEASNKWGLVLGTQTLQDHAYMGVDDTYSGYQLVFADATYYFLGRDFDHPLQSDPTMFFHSGTDPNDDNTQWMSLTHNQSAGIISTGNGSIVLKPNSSIVDVSESNISNVNDMKINSIEGRDGTEVRIGAGATCNGAQINGINDLCIDDDLEVEGALYAGDTITTDNSDAHYIAGITFGGETVADGTGELFSYTVQSKAQYLLLIDDTLGYQYVLGGFAYWNRDFDHPPQTNPTLYIQSATDPDTDNTQWMGLQHNKSAGIISTGNGSIILKPNSSNVDVSESNISNVNDMKINSIEGRDGTEVRIGAGATCNAAGMNGINDLCIDDSLEVEGLAYFDSGLIVSSGQQVQLGGSEVWVYFGSAASNNNMVRGDTTKNQLLWAIDSNYGRQFSFTGEYDDRINDYDHPTLDDFKLYLHSQTDPDDDNTQWIGLQHNKSAGIIDTGNGSIVLKPNSSNVDVEGSLTIINGSNQGKIWHNGSGICIGSC